MNADHPETRRILELERRLAEGSCSPAELEGLLHPDFLEVGISGKTWGREETLSVLRSRSAKQVDLVLLGDRPLARDLRQLVYWLSSAGTSSIRSSIWRRDGSSWRILFHQGTSRQAPI